jgi:hypothetical protein
MKFNKWTVGLAAVGAVSLASVVHAEEKASSVMTAVSSTTLSGYVDTSINWNVGTGNARVANYAFNTPAKQDGFNLDAVDVKISKALDESEWAAGYMVDLLLGPDGTALGTGGPIVVGGQNPALNSIKQAYVNVRTPVGNGLDWKLGVFDNIIGYESTESPSNPNFSRSYGYTLEPTTLTGLLASYKFSELVSASAGIANQLNPAVGGSPAAPAGEPLTGPGRANPPQAESYKAYVASVALTAPNDWGFISGSSLYLGFNNGYLTENGVPTTTTFYYVGATINTPVTGLKAGLSFDHGQYRPINGITATTANWANAVDGYASYQATEKMSLHTRAEYFWQKSDFGPIAGPNKVFALTETVQYDLWKNVLSRLELRWDHQAGNNVTGLLAGTGATAGGGWYGGTPGLGGGVTGGAAAGKHDSFTVVANLAYKF